MGDHDYYIFTNEAAPENHSKYAIPVEVFWGGFPR